VGKKKRGDLARTQAQKN